MQPSIPHWSTRLALFLSACAGFMLHGFAQDNASQPDRLQDHVVFLSTFDGTTTAGIAKGDRRLFTAKNRESINEAKSGLLDPAVTLAPGKGLVGDAMEFKEKKRLLTFYQAQGNVAYSKTSWSGCISFWLQLDPAEDLEPGYCDPIQITDSGYNDAAIWVDFTKDNPRDFRLGIIGDLVAWNPKDAPPENNPEFERRLITVTDPPFARGKWTHVVINFSGFNSDQGESQLYINGVAKGTLRVTDPFTWQEDQARILLGLNYIGLFDELAIFDRPLREAEIRRLYEAKGTLLHPQR
jgi:hypothetical protein